MPILRLSQKESNNIPVRYIVSTTSRLRGWNGARWTGVVLLVVFSFFYSAEAMVAQGSVGTDTRQADTSHPGVAEPVATVAALSAADEVLGQSTAATPSPAQQPLPDDPSAKPADQTSHEKSKSDCRFIPCPAPLIDWYMRFENGPQVRKMTPEQKGWLATRNLIDPFNMITIVGTAGITIAADSHSAYGPGMPGFGRYVGVTFTEDLTGEFFGTFLIPSIAHQDPHYHRMPKASYPKRIFHAINQVVWTQSDNGSGMLNYANLAGFAIDDEIGNLYVPGRQTNAGATAQRYAIGLATAPIDNFITEFLPDVAKHIHVQVVVVQRIINQIANKDSGGAF